MYKYIKDNNKIKKHSNSLTTYKNVLINIECYIAYLIKGYDLKDILKLYLDKFKLKYKNKIWFMSLKFKVNDFLDLVGEFKDKYESNHKKMEFALKSDSKIHKSYVMFGGQKGYFVNGIFYKVEGIPTIGDILREFPLVRIKEDS
ncbi:plasmid maintenance protein [Borreliella lusitaniae]|uniref:plasmid maintenance protein n=1 Tax=Borreliella lusitaniae TaxID=100177 RepID=UPI00341631EB